MTKVIFNTVSPKHLSVFQAIHLSPEMSRSLVPIFPFLLVFSFLASTGKQWENSLSIPLKATETTCCQIEKLKQKLFFHTEVPLLQRKDD